MRYTLKPEGPKTAQLAVVCEKPAVDEVREGRLLVGPSGSRVRAHLAKAGLNAGSSRELSQQVWLTNAVQSFDDPRSNPTDADIIRELPRLYRELCALPNLNCVLGMGAVALKALTNLQYDEITKRRGSRLVSTCGGIKFVPTFHPAFYMRGEWRFAPIVQFDTQRAVSEAKWPEIRSKPRNFRIRPNGYNEAYNWITEIIEGSKRSGYCSFDIETSRAGNGSWYISCIGLAPTITDAYCIPIMHRDRSMYFTLSDEIQIWRYLAYALNLPGVCYVSQNGCAFDSFQLRKHGIPLTQMAKGFDTFSAHSLLAPDLPHDLGFLVSLYTEEPYYKDESGRGEILTANAWHSDLRANEDQFWLYNCKDAAFTLECAFGIMEDLRSV